MTSSNDTLKATAQQMIHIPIGKIKQWYGRYQTMTAAQNFHQMQTDSIHNERRRNTNKYLPANQSGEFVIPFIWSNSKEFKISLDSEQAGWKGKRIP
ncbi:MAG: hypothetical protein ACLVI9_05685 [Anaerostipes hadrus]